MTSGEKRGWIAVAFGTVLLITAVILLIFLPTILPIGEDAALCPSLTSTRASQPATSST